MVLHCRSKNPPTSSTLSTRRALAAQQRKENTKNLQWGVIDPALIWRCFRTPCGPYDSMVYVTANGAHTDEWSVTHNPAHANADTHRTLVVKSTSRHPLPLPAQWGWTRWFLKSWRGRWRVKLEHWEGNSTAASWKAQNMAVKAADADRYAFINMSLSWKQGVYSPARISVCYCGKPVEKICNRHGEFVIFSAALTLPFFLLMPHILVAAFVSLKARLCRLTDGSDEDLCSHTVEEMRGNEVSGPHLWGQGLNLLFISKATVGKQ